VPKPTTCYNITATLTTVWPLGLATTYRSCEGCTTSLSNVHGLGESKTGVLCFYAHCLYFSVVVQCFYMPCWMTIHMPYWMTILFLCVVLLFKDIGIWLFISLTNNVISHVTFTFIFLHCWRYWRACISL